MAEKHDNLQNEVLTMITPFCNNIHLDKRISKDNFRPDIFCELKNSSLLAIEIGNMHSNSTIRYCYENDIPLLWFPYDYKVYLFDWAILKSLLVNCNSFYFPQSQPSIYSIKPLRSYKLLKKITNFNSYIKRVASS